MLFENSYLRGSHSQWVRGSTADETFYLEYLGITRMGGLTGGYLESFMEILLDPCS
jgi:hypothetical protein